MGAALRELYLLVETYAGALYLEEPSQDASTVINSQQHKKMVFHVLMKPSECSQAFQRLTGSLGF